MGHLFSTRGTTELPISAEDFMTNAGANRPLSYGEKDRRTYITYKSEMEIRCQNDGNGNPIYIGRARVGTAESEDKWQISFHTWDANDSLLSKQWPLDDLGAASCDYEFVWDDRGSYVYV